MSQTKCPDCSEILSRRDVMLRHRRNKHSGSQVSQAYPQNIEAYPSPPPPQEELRPSLASQPPQWQKGVIQPTIPPQNDEIPRSDCNMASQEQADLAKPKMVLHQ